MSFEEVIIYVKIRTTSPPKKVFTEKNHHFEINKFFATLRI